MSGRPAQMFEPRRIDSHASWLDADGVKLYTISARARTVEQTGYRARLAQVKTGIEIDWPSTAAFAIFHDGATAAYLVLAWWGNDNELFTSVSARSTQGWVEDPRRYSFCLWDLEVFWFERNRYVELVYRAAPDLDAYRAARLVARDA